MRIFRQITKILIGLIILLLSIILIGFAYEHICRYRLSERYHPEGSFANIGNHKLHYLKKGCGGPTVIFESGLDPGGHLPWFKIQDEISKYTTTISYDRAGVLWSERGNNPKTGYAMSKELNDLLIKSDCPKPYIVVGHSLAGLFLRSFIKDHKSDISGIVFVDVSHPEQNIRRPKNLESLSKFQSSYLIRFASTTGLLRLFYNNTYPNTSTEDSINLIVHTLFYKGVSTFIEEQNSLHNLLEESKPRYTFDSIPLRIITGTSINKYLEIKDQKLRTEFMDFKFSLQKDLLKESKNSLLINASKSGHYIQLEQPEIVINTIKELLLRNSKKIKNEP